MQLKPIVFLRMNRFIKERIHFNSIIQPITKDSEQISFLTFCRKTAAPSNNFNPKSYLLFSNFLYLEFLV